MSALVILDPQDLEGLAVDPGGRAQCKVRVKNTGTLVQQYHMVVLGDTAAWAKVEPPILSLFPGNEDTVTIVFTPPQEADVLPGETAFGLKVTPETEADQGVVEEGIITVGRFDDISAELLPSQAKSRRSTRHRVAIDSRGNAPVRVSIQALDPKDEVVIKVSPQVFTLEPGKATFASVRVKTRKQFFRGAPKTHPFKVLVGPDNMATIELDGSMVQPPAVPALLLPVAAIMALVLIWFSLFKPALQSAARDAVEEPIVALEKDVAETKKDVEEIKTPETTAAPPPTTASTFLQDSLATTTTTLTPVLVPIATTSTTATTLAGGTGTAGGSTGGAGGAGATGDPFDRRLELVAAPGDSQTNAYTVPTGKTLKVTDLILQNVNGTAGDVRIQRVTPTATSDLLVTKLENSSGDQTYQFQTPLVFKAGEKIQLRVDCRPAQSACQVGVLISGGQA